MVLFDEIEIPAGYEYTINSSTHWACVFNQDTGHMAQRDIRECENVADAILQCVDQIQNEIDDF